MIYVSIYQAIGSTLGHQQNSNSFGLWKSSTVVQTTHGLTQSATQHGSWVIISYISLQVYNLWSVTSMQWFPEVLISNKKKKKKHQKFPKEEEKG